MSSHLTGTDFKDAVAYLQAIHHADAEGLHAIRLAVRPQVVDALAALYLGLARTVPGGVQAHLEWLGQNLDQLLDDGDNPQ